VAALLLAVLAAYANHFQNGFHFDDYHSIADNAFITHLRNVPLFFTGVEMSSTRPDTATYRPLTTASLAFDYWLGHGQPFWFHLSTFLWFLVQLVLMFSLFRRLTDRAAPHPSNPWTALAATACYGLHPANAETVNYIVQRADLYSTLGVVASLLCFVTWPGQRRWGWYLIPAVAADLSKAPALIFPFILLAYVWLFEEKHWRATIPAFVVTAAAAILTTQMTPPTFEGGAASASLYRITQPWVALHYFKSFFLPTGLSADTDWTYVDPFSPQAIAGYLFVIALLAAAFYTARRRETRPIAFGLFWFFLALLPTSLLPLAEVTNDHRMFFPFVGLALAVFWTARLAFKTTQARKPVPRTQARMPVLLIVVVLAAEAAGTHARNQVWRTEESLWQDVAAKSPRNARGLMNYGITFANRGDHLTALSYMERALALMPDYSFLEMNLGITCGNLGRDAEAERHYNRAIALAPGLAEPRFTFATWLRSKGRTAEAQTQLEAAVRLNPLSFPARNLLMEIYSQQGNWQALDGLIEDSLRLSHNDELARRYLAERAYRPPNPAGAPQSLGDPQALLHQSAGECRAGKYEECIATARKALALQPDYAEAYNNIAAAYLALHRWDEAIQAATQALRLKPDFEMAQKVLQRARARKQAER